MQMNTLKDVVNNRPLEVNDVVVFKVNGVEYRYKVYSNCLICVRKNNDAIFEALGLNKMSFTRPLYSADAPRTGSWPMTQNDDMESLTRVVCALYLAIEAVKPTIELVIGGVTVELSEESSQAILAAAKKA